MCIGDYDKPTGTQVTAVRLTDDYTILDVQFTNPVEQVSFSLYFERLDKGIETFDWSWAQNLA